jgi:hypothetical protein
MNIIKDTKEEMTYLKSKIIYPNVVVFENKKPFHTELENRNIANRNKVLCFVDGRENREFATTCKSSCNYKVAMLMVKYHKNF